MRKLYFLLFLIFLAQTVNAAAVIPNDPRYPEAWYLEKINAPSAWTKTTGSRKIIVAVLDSGVQVNHPDLTDNIWTNPNEQLNGLDNDGNGLVGDVHGWDFVNNTPNPGPNFDEEKKFSGFIHGTLIAGLIGAVGNNGTDSVGVNWVVSLMPLRVLDSKGEGRVAEVIKAIDYAISKKVDVINMSFTGLNYNEALNQAIGRANAAGIVVVAAAGNDDKPGGGDGSGDTPHYPACFGGPNDEPWAVIGVAAVDRDNKKTRFSNYGSKCIDLVAPGVNMAGLLVYAPTRPGFESSYGGNWSGTSVSAALVSGAAALLKSLKSDLKPKEIYELLTTTADNIFPATADQTFQGQLGAGLLDVNKAVEALLAKYPALAPTPVATGVGGKIILSSPSSALVQIFSIPGKLENSFYAYKNKKIGAQAAVGEFGFGVGSQLVTAPLNDRAPVRFFDLNGEPMNNDLFPFGKKWQDGVNIALADLDHDGEDEIIAAPRNRGGEVRIFKRDGQLVGKFWPFGPRYKGGVNLAVGDFDGSGEPRIAAAVAGRGRAQVRFFNSAGDLINPGFFTYEENWRGGIKIVGLPVSGRGTANLITSPAGKRAADINVYNQNGVLQNTFLAEEQPVKDLALAAGRSNDRSIIVTARPTKEPVIKMWQADGALLKSFQIKGKNFSNGINLFYWP